MATQVQFRRGTTAQNNAFTGAVGEITVNTDKDSLVVHDGSTQGGFGVAKNDLSNVSSVGVLTASSFSGDGSNLTGITAGATLSAGSGSQRVVVTSLTTGTMTSAATDAELTYNSGTNALTATTFVGALTGNADTATTSTNVTVADESSDTTCFPLFATAATGNLPPKSGTNLTFNSSSGQLTATSFSGDGSALTGIDATSIKDSNGTVRVQGNTSGVVVSGIATATTFVGALTGNVTGNVTGNTSGTAGGLTGAPSITVADITATGNVSIAGTLTYEDVTSVDAVGIVTARTGVRVTSGGLTVSAGGADITGNIAVTGTVDGRDVATDGTKLDGIESSATADQTAAEIRTLVGSASDSNVFTDADHSKLDGIEASATADQSDAEIRAAVEAATDSNVFTDADHSKLNGIASGATNVTNNNQLTNGAGYITSANGGNAATLDSIDSSSFLRSDAADQKTSGTLRFNDNVILSLGSSDDAEFFVNGSHLYLDLNSGIGDFYIRDGTTTRFTFDDAGHFTASGNLTANSDITLKENIETIPNALDKVLNLRGVEYDRIDIEGNPHQIGVIAQEIEEVIPEVVSTNEEGIKSVAYGNIVGVLIEAVKEQQKQINDLKDEIKSMKG